MPKIVSQLRLQENEQEDIVSNTEFHHLDNVKSNIQEQIDDIISKPLPHYTTQERINLNLKLNGLVVFDLDLLDYYLYINDDWQLLREFISPPPDLIDGGNA